MVPNPLAVKADELMVEYEGSKFAWALLGEIWRLEKQISEHCCGCAMLEDSHSCENCEA